MTLFYGTEFEKERVPSSNLQKDVIAIQRLSK